MSAERHRVIIDASESFAQAAQRAESAGQYGRAALLYRAALLVLEGHPIGEVELLLETMTGLLGPDRAPPAPRARGPAIR